MFKIGDDVSFKAGDRVKFMESSLASGMIDAKEDDVFTVKESYKRVVTLEELQGCYHVTHFEHVKEEVMNNTEEKEIKWEGSQIDWQVGQGVFCLLRGKGVIANTSYGGDYPIEVEFEKDFEYYTNDGKLFDYHKNRTLFFSEPKIIAEKFPPKKPFVPKLKKGDIIIYRERGSSCSHVGVVDYEDHDSVTLEDSDVSMYKHAFEFHKLGEEIIFN